MKSKSAQKQHEKYIFFVNKPKPIEILLFVQLRNFLFSFSQTSFVLSPIIIL